MLDELEPDLIHAHDFHTVGIAARAAARLRARGRQVKWIYDAHEYVAGTRGGATLRLRLRHRFFVGQEREYAPLADAVVTVSDPIAERLERDLALSPAPTVVANVPPSATDLPPTSLRQAAGVDATTPVVVYSGSCAPQRGVRTVVEAMAHLAASDGPAKDAVLVLVASDEDRHVASLRALARDRGIEDRLRTVPFVSPDAVPGYLAEADVGVTPLLHRPNHQLSLNTKYAEYVHARLPIVTSDVRTMAAFTRAQGIGEVFAAGDPADCAQAIERVLTDPKRYSDTYSDGQLVAMLSWERQEEVLGDLYARLLGHRPEPIEARGPLLLQAVSEHDR